MTLNPKLLLPSRKHRDVWQYGDFQTPPALAGEVCRMLARRGIAAPAILEPTCGRGAFLVAAACALPGARTLLGVEVNGAYAAEARQALIPAKGRADVVEQGDFFTTDWERILGSDPGPWLVLGNPPWVTNTELGSLNSSNLPVKSNFQGHRGLDAITGKANFDISEWMLLAQLAWLKRRSGWIAMLVKTSVARKVLKQAWKRHDPIGRAAIFKIDAMQHFGAAVEACLFILPVNVGAASQDCDVYPDLGSRGPAGTIGFHDGMLVSNVAAYVRHHRLIGANPDYVWRSGVKHDCAKVMELTASTSGKFVNRDGDEVSLEDSCVFPMLKSSDVAKGSLRKDRFMIVTQHVIGQDTSSIAMTAPKTWSYLQRNGAHLDKRGSVIYNNKPRFSIFGVGDYTFAPWKVAISGFYKNFHFLKVGPLAGKPYVFDDTIYFLPCWSEPEADFILALVQSPPYRELLGSLVFHDEKRPITAELLKKISLERVAAGSGRHDEYRKFRQSGTPQLDLAFAGDACHGDCRAM